MHEKILNFAKTITSSSEEEIPLLDALCTAAESELTGRLREGVTAEDCGDLFLYAAALVAAGDLFPFRQDGDIQQFTAGDISVRLRSGNGGHASSTRSQALALLSPYLRDDEFAFVGVQG